MEGLGYFSYNLSLEVTECGMREVRAGRLMPDFATSRIFFFTLVSMRVH